MIEESAWLLLMTWHQQICNHHDDLAGRLTWWRHQMETFSALLALCARNSLFTGEFPSQRPVTRSFDVFFDLRLNKRLSKQSWGWWLSGVPDFFDRNKILSGGDLSHYQVPHCIRVFFDFVWFVFIHHNFQFYFELCTYCNILDIYLSQNLNFVKSSSVLYEIIELFIF